MAPPRSIEIHGKIRKVASPAHFETLLHYLRSQGIDEIHRASGLERTCEKLGRCATGFPALDHLLKGGLPRGRLSEIVGPPSSGRTSLAYSLLTRLTTAGEFTSWIEIGDAFDPPSAAAAGVLLERVLWVRASTQIEAFRASERILKEGGFALLLLDLCGTEDVAPTAIWPRLRRHAAGCDTCLVVLGDTRSTGAFADLALEFQHAKPRFVGTPPLLEGLKGEIILSRNRLGRDAINTPFSTSIRTT